MSKIINVKRGIMGNVMKLMIFVAIIALGLYVYARYIEPECLILQEEMIYTERLNCTEPLRVVQCSDLHLGPDYDMAHLERIVNKINALDADILVFTGDLVDDNRSFTDVQITKELLSSLNAKYGKYAIMGNHDYGWKGPRLYYEIIKASGFQLLINESVAINIDKKNKLNIIGVDDIIFGEPDIHKAMKKVGENDYNILLCHEPDVAEKFQDYPIDLQLSGHSHGGQVSIPFIGAPFTTKYGHKYIRGMYQMPDNPRMQLYVNIGIGTSQKRYRFGCMPELTVFTLN